MTLSAQVGVVVIGRNEGERLKRCFSSLQTQYQGPIVYVDSGSNDGSLEYAQSRGIDLVNLDMSSPFTMARARNSGLSYLKRTFPNIQFVQFVDGDCELNPGWLAQAYHYLLEHKTAVCVCGHRRERFPTNSLYNGLIDMEWQGDLGEIEACGGDAMYRIDAFQKVTGFNDSMIAGEEGELCLRLRMDGGKIIRLDLPMTLHDADVHRLSQWWMRSVRCGHAYAQGYDLQRHNQRLENEVYKQHKVLSSLFYGAAVPLLFLVMAILFVTLSASVSWLLFLAVGMAFLASLYIPIIRKSASSKLTQTGSTDGCLLYGFFISLGKFPEAQGVLKYYKNKLFGKAARIIEYRRH